MPENQNIEYKQIWKDDYFKQISAFANSDGGDIYIGVNDNGKTIGVNNSKKLLVEIPNKAVQYLGISLKVFSDKKDDKPILKIIVPKSSVPISYKGKYYIRSGATVQEIRGQELNNLILKKLGKTFDELPLESASLYEIKQQINFVERR